MAAAVNGRPVDEVDGWVLGTLLPGFAGTELPDWVRAALDAGLPGVALYGHNIADDASLPRLAQQVRAGWPDALVAVDEEGGDVTRLEYRRGSSYPGNLALGTVDDETATYAVGRAMAADLRSAGVTVDLAPSVDVNSAPDNPVIGVRSFGARAELVGRHGAAMVRGLQDGGVASVAKHFPGHGATTTDSHLTAPVVDADLEVLRARELPPFEAVVRAGVLGIMTGHVVLPAVDRRPATLSRRLLDLLREELGFAGAIVTDALDMAAVRDRYGIPGAAGRALAAGADLLLLGARDQEQSFVDTRRSLREAVLDGRVDPQRAADAAARTRRLRQATAALVAADPVRDRAGWHAARAAVSTGGRPLDADELRAGLVVVELRGTTNEAVGDAGWSLAGPVAALGVEVEQVTVHDGRPSPVEVLAGAAGRQVVVAVRDACRSPWQRAWTTGLLQASRDAVLVGLGMPDDAALARSAAGPEARWAMGLSASRVSAEAVADALVRGSS